MVTLGVISDTHIPDRRKTLHPQVLPIFRKAGVQAILHAGDISIQAVLDELGEVAPVHAVLGNRDIYYLRHLPRVLSLQFEGVNILLTHGHGRWWNYILDRTRFYFEGLNLDLYTSRLLRNFPDPQVIVYGHTHISMNETRGGLLLFNPGSACCSHRDKYPRGVGLLHLENGAISTEIIPFLKE